MLLFSWRKDYVHNIKISKVMVGKDRASGYKRTSELSGSSIELQVRINCTSCRRPVQGKFWRLGPGPVYSETQSLVTLYQGFHFVTFLRLPSCDKRKWISYHLTQVWWLLYNGAYGWMTQDFKRYVQEKRADDIVWCLFYFDYCLICADMLSNLWSYFV